MSRYQWKTLPQGMATSPTLCQHFVAQAVNPLTQQWPHIYLIHYMDDILLAGVDRQVLLCCCQALVTRLTSFGLKMAPDKIQLKEPFFYLGFELYQ